MIGVMGETLKEEEENMKYRQCLFTKCPSVASNTR